MDAPIKILYEDNHLIAVWKPAGVLTQGDASGEKCLMDDVKEYIKKKYAKPGNVFLGLVHRLDRPVQGIVLFAKTSKGASRLSEQFRLRTVKKTYYAMVEGVPGRSSGKIRTGLLKEKKGQTLRAKITSAGEAEEASLDYSTVKNFMRYTLLKIDLHTGKFHQIRAQLASLGTPIVGDVKYGAKKSDALEGIALAACELSFAHPITEERIRLHTPWPAEWESIAAS